MTAACTHYAAAHGITDWKSTALEEVATPTRTRDGTLGAVLLKVMANGAWWHVDDALAEVLKLGHATTKASLNAALCRGASDGGLFEHGRRGMYRVRPELVEQWKGVAMEIVAA